MSLLTRARAQCHRPYWMVQSGFLFFFLHIMTVLFFIGVRSAVPLISVFTPSLLPVLTPFHLPPPRSLFGQFHQGATRMWASLLFHHGVTLSGEKYSLMGFLLLSFLLASPLLLPPTLSCLIVPRFLILPSFSGDFPLCSHSAFF